MKKMSLIAGTALLFIACTSDYDSAAATILPEDIVINQVVFNSSGGYNYNRVLEYDEEGRDNSWTYSPLQIYREEPTPTYDNGSPVFTYTLNLDSQGRIAESFTTNLQSAYTRYYTYDNKGRVVKEEIFEQFLDFETGTPVTNLELNETNTLTWNDDDNLVSVRSQYVNSEYYFLTSFSDFSPEYINTVKPENFGFNFFGSAGYPAGYLHGGGNGGFYYNDTMAGANLPLTIIQETLYTDTDMPYNGYSDEYTVTYEKDDKNRITEIYLVAESGYWSKTRYNYN